MYATVRYYWYDITVLIDNYIPIVSKMVVDLLLLQKDGGVLAQTRLPIVYQTEECTKFKQT